MLSDQLHLVWHSLISKNSQKPATNSTKFHFPSTSQQMTDARQEARDVHVNSSWCIAEDTVKCPLEAPIFRFPSGYVYLRSGVTTGLGFRTYIYVRMYERVNKHSTYSEVPLWQIFGGKM